MQQYADVIMIARKSNADELTNLAKLRKHGVSTEQRFQRIKKALLE